MKKLILTIMVIQSFLYAKLVIDKERNLMRTTLRGDYPTSATWADAIQECNDLDSYGYTDWRLPNASEVLSTNNGDKWSSTTVNVDGDTSKAMAKVRINPAGSAGIMHYSSHDKTETLHFECVRSMK